MPTDKPMQLGMIGLGRMGANLVRRLMQDGHQCVAFDRNPDTVKQLLYNIKVNVGLEKRQAHLAQGLIHNLVVQDPLDSEVLEYLLKPILECIKHLRQPDRETNPLRRSKPGANLQDQPRYFAPFTKAKQSAP